MTQANDYRAIKGVSNSLMSVYEDDYPSFLSYWVYNKSLPDKSTGSLTLGSLVDTLLTRPEDYPRLFSVYEGKAPTGQMNTFCRGWAKLGNEIDAYNAVGFKRKGDTLEKILEKFEEFKDFFAVLKSCKDCAVITKEDDIKAHQKFEEMKTNRYVSAVVNAKNTPFQDVFHQLELQYTVEGLRLKGALDKVIVLHDVKKIYPIDYKTSFDSLQFEESYKKYRYYRQGSFYTYLIKIWAEERGWSDYEIQPFTFVVCSTMSTKHFSYKMSDHDIQMAEKGGYLDDGTYIKGWQEILLEIRFMSAKGDWTYPYKVVFNNGVVPLRIFRR